MMFSVIYWVDVPSDTCLGPHLPSQRKLFETTEGDESYEYDYLEGVWSKGKHRKLCGLLNRRQFERFVSDVNIFADDVETLGSLGAPGCGLGLMPAISFRGDDEYDVIKGAYVTPFPNFEPKHRAEDGEWQERCFRRLRKLIIRRYS